MFKKLREKFKNKAFSKVMLSLGLAGVCAGTLATGIALLAPFPKAFIDYGDATQIEEIWNDNGYFKPAAFNELLSAISKGATFDNLTSIETAAAAKKTAEDLRTNNGGKEIVVTLGDLKWTPTYLSKDNQGNTILTLWLTNSSQLSGENITSSTTFNANGTSTWSSGWYKDAPEYTYPSNMYGTSYIRTVTLNNGGKYSKSDSSSPSSDADVYTETATQDSASVFAKFTMDNVPGSLTKYIVTPYNVQWQEYGQNNTKTWFSYSVPNENWSDQIPNDGTYEGTTYKFSSYNNASYNYAGKGADNYAWRDDKIWLPSLTETGYSDTKIGLWNTSTTQRQNSIYSWLRSGRSNRADFAFNLDASGSNYYSYYVYDSYGVRPALHLNLDSAALSAATAPPPSWLDYAADAFANETDVDGSSEEQAYEIESAQQLALLAKRVNDEETNADWADKFYKLTDDIMLAQYPWVPIGLSLNRTLFFGNFDGQGHTIYGLNFDVENTSSDESDIKGYGLFGNTEGATVQNLNLRDGEVKAKGDMAASLVGVAYSSEITNVSSNVNVSGSGSPFNVDFLSREAAPCVGGLVCYLFDDSSISGCSYTGNVFAQGDAAAGGLVGFAGGQSDGEITNCAVDCLVSGTDCVGILIGNNSAYSHHVYISNCIARGTILGNGYIFSGSDHPPMITACYFYGTASDDTLVLDSTMTACYAVVNGRVITSGDVDSSWTNYWAVLPGLNGGLPVQKELFWSAGVASSTVDELKRALGLE